MDSDRLIVAATRMTVVVLVLFTISFFIDLLYDELTWSNFHVFTVPWAFGSIIFLLFSFRENKFRFFRRRTKFTVAFISFLYMILIGSLPFMFTELVDPISSIFESTAGFTTTGLTSIGTDELLEHSHGMLFYRVAIQWVGGLFYLVFAFIFLSDISDSAQRSADRRLFTRIGLVPNLSSLLQNLTIIYGVFTFISFLLFNIAGKNVFDSICLSMATISTGGLSSEGRILGEGAPILILITVFMFMAGMGYYVHMSWMSARGRRKTLFDIENISYLLLAFSVPIIGMVILLSEGNPLGRSILNSLFTTISALTTTGFMVEGMDQWPDSMKLLLMILMLMGGASLSLSSGFKVQRTFLLIKGFLAEVRRSSHPNAVVTLRRGDGTYSDKALESANMSFFYLFGLIGITIGLLLLFHDDIFESLGLCITAVSNSGMAFGTFSTTEGISSLNWFVKVVLTIIMVLGRFEILLPLYILTLRGRKFTG
jgi:trk system potassium uptake protein TrkH